MTDMAARRSEPANEAVTEKLAAGSGTTVPLSSELSKAGKQHYVLDVIHPTPCRIHLERESTILGRDGDPNTRLDGHAVSRRHAEVRLCGGVAAIRDLGSRNGVYVDGERVEQGRLKDNSLVRIGDHLAVVRQLNDRSSIRFSKHLHGLWGSEGIAACAQLTQTAAKSDQPALILGESGTGKELFAQAIHAQSARRGNFVALNCAALSPHLIEAELFGHEKNAFTDARKSRPGLCRSASGGTLFLDELGELPLDAQAKLLRVIQSGEVTPVGADHPVAVDVRYLAATHRELPELVEAGRFRLDLYHRLCGISLRLPPLRERREDILPLFRMFLRQQLEKGVPELGVLLAEALCLHAWPGNVRELQQIGSAMALLHGNLERWRLPQLPPELVAAAKKPSTAPQPASQKRSTSHGSRPRHIDKQALARALTESEGNVSRAAMALGVARESLYALTRKFQLEPDAFRRAKSRGVG